jgi:hypothetical protein
MHLSSRNCANRRHLLFPSLGPTRSSAILAYQYYRRKRAGRQRRLSDQEQGLWGQPEGQQHQRHSRRVLERDRLNGDRENSQRRAGPLEPGQVYVP